MEVREEMEKEVRVLEEEGGGGEEGERSCADLAAR